MKTNTTNTQSTSVMNNQKIMVAFFDVKNDHFDLRMVADVYDSAVVALTNTPAYNKILCSAPYVLDKHRIFNSHTDCGYLDEWESNDEDYIQIEWCEKPFDTTNHESVVAHDNFCYRRVKALWYESWEDSEIDFEDYCTNNPDYEIKHRLKRINVIPDQCGGKDFYSPRYEDFYIFHSENGVRVYCSDYGVVYHKWTDSKGYKHASLTFTPNYMNNLPSVLAYINTLA